MADETLNLNITATLADFSKQMAQIPGITEKEAKGMVSALNNNFKKAAQEAARAGKRINGEFDKSFNSIRQGAGAIFGGIVNDIDDVVGALGGVATVVGPVGVAMGALALGVGVGVGALVMLEGAALTAADALAKAGQPIDPAMMRSIEEANAAVGAMGTAFQQVTTTLGAVFGPLLSETIQLILTLGYAMSDALGISGTMRLSLTDLAKFMANALNGAFMLATDAIVSMGYAVAAVGDAVGLSTGKFRFYVSVLEQWGDTNAAANKELIENINLMDYVDDRVKQNTASALTNIQARDNSTAAVKAESKAVEELGVDYDKLNAAMTKSMEGMHVDQGAAWAKMLGDVGDEMTATSQAITGGTQEDLAALSQGLQTYGAMTGMVVGAYGDLVEQVFSQTANRAATIADTAAQASQDAMAQYRAATEDFEANADTMSEADRKRAMARIALLKSESKAARKAAKETSEAEKKASLESFRAQQVTAAVQAGIQFAVNMGTLIPAFSWLMAGAPAAAAGVAGAVLTAQQALIWSQAPPAFYTGGMAPGETPAVLHSGESVLNRRATQQVGPDVINAINQGRQFMSGSGTTVVNLDSRVLATIGREGRRRDSPMPTRLGSMYGVG